MHPVQAPFFFGHVSGGNYTGRMARFYKEYNQ
jgi:hypothetical protein